MDYAENDDVAVGTYSAVDPEGEEVKYGVNDEDNFAITEDGGVLTFVKSPDFETAKEHKVTVTANDADLIEVTITITNMEEGAVVTVVPPRPQYREGGHGFRQGRGRRRGRSHVDVGAVLRHDGVDADRRCHAIPATPLRARTRTCTCKRR